MTRRPVVSEMKRVGRASSMVSAVEGVASAAKGIVESPSLGERVRNDFPILDQVCELVSPKEFAW